MTTQAILPAKPASPIKGRNNVRVRFPFDLTTAARRALWAAIPAAHCYQSSYGGVVRYISPEAVDHFAAEIAALKDQAAQLANKKEIKAKIAAMKEAIAKQLARNPINAQHHDRASFFALVAQAVGATSAHVVKSCKHTYHHFVIATLPAARYGMEDGKTVRNADSMEQITVSITNREISEKFGRTASGQPKLATVEEFAAWLKAHKYAWQSVEARIKSAKQSYENRPQLA